MPETTDKEKIFLEIRQTIKFLLRERDQGRVSFEISDFFVKELEDEILNNFDDAINRTEYEETILELFGAKKGKKVEISQGRIHREVEKLIRQYRMRSRKQILQKLITQFQPLPSEIELTRDFVVESYNKLMQNPLKIKISSLVKEGTTDLRRVMSVLRREKYDVEQSIVKKILDKIVLDLEKTRRKFSRGRVGRKSSTTYSAATATPIKDRLIQQMQKSLIQKTRYKKQRFIRSECPKFKFELSENKIEEDMRIVVYSGSRDSSVFRVKTFLANERITDILISCLKNGNTRAADINISEFQKAVAHNKGEAFLQRWVKNANKQLAFSNVQELLWFLMSILNERFGLPAGVSNYLKSRFVKHLIELDKSLTKYVIEKALENA